MPSYETCPSSKLNPLANVDLSLDPVVVPRVSIVRAIQALPTIEALALARATWNLTLEQAKLVLVMLRHPLV